MARAWPVRTTADVTGAARFLTAVVFDWFCLQGREPRRRYADWHLAIHRIRGRPDPALRWSVPLASSEATPMAFPADRYAAVAQNGVGGDGLDIEVGQGVPRPNVPSPTAARGHAKTCLGGMQGSILLPKVPIGNHRHGYARQAVGRRRHGGTQ